MPKKHILIPFMLEMCQQCMYLGELNGNEPGGPSSSFICGHPKGEKRLIARIHISDLSRRHPFYIPEWCPMKDNEIWDTSGKKKE